jgi:hypothetical protein
MDAQLARAALTIVPVLCVAIPAALAILLTIYSFTMSRDADRPRPSRCQDDWMWTIWPAATSLLMLLWMLDRLAAALAVPASTRVLP